MIDRFKLLYDSEVNKNLLAQNDHLTTEQIDLLYQTKGVKKYNLAQHPRLTEEQFMRAFNDKDVNKTYLAQNPNLTTEQIDLLYQTKGVDKKVLASYPKLTEKQFMLLFDSKFFTELCQNDHLTPEQIDLLYQTEDVDSKESLATYSKLTAEQFMRFFNDKDFNKDALAMNSHITTEQIDLLYQTEDVDSLLVEIANYSNLTDEQFMRIFNYADFNKSISTKNRLAQNPNLTTEQIDLLYETEGVDKELLAQYPKLTEKQFMRFFNDRSFNKNYLARNPSINAPANQPFASGIFNWKW